MMKFVFQNAVFFANILYILTQNPLDPLCANRICSAGQICRVLQKCESGSCQQTAFCMSDSDSQYLSGGCRIGEPLVQAAQNGTGGARLPWSPFEGPYGQSPDMEARPFATVACHRDSPCPAGFYCSSELQDTESRCCRSRDGAQLNAGGCPQVTSDGDSVWTCMDQCLTDGDCSEYTKCCQISQECTRSKCKVPI